MQMFAVCLQHMGVMVQRDTAVTNAHFTVGAPEFDGLYFVNSALRNQHLTS